MSSRFEPGQVWTYDHRPGEEDSRLTILRVDQDGVLGQIVHVCVDGVGLPQSVDPELQSTRRISHMPFSAEAVAESVGKHVDTVEVPDHAEGYGHWREAFEREEAGVFTITVGEAVDAIVTVNSQGQDR